MNQAKFRTIKTCYVCGTNKNLHLHHIFYGLANRKQSEKYGCTVYLCAIHHNLSNAGVHFNKELDNELKMKCEEWCLKEYGWTKEDFIKRFGRNYL